MINHVYFSEAWIAAVKEREKTDAHVKTLVEAVLSDAEASDSYETLGFAYYYTGDDKYLEKAHKHMMEQLDSPRWENHDFVSTDLGTASMCIQLAVGYSLFADKIPAEDRKRIAEVTYKRGIYPSVMDWVMPGHKVHAFDTMGHNWWAVCVASAAMASVVMQEDLPECRELTEISAKALGEWFAYQGNPMNTKPKNFDNGAFYEGVTYIDYLLHEYLQFAIAYKSITGAHPFDDTAYLEQSAAFILHASYFSDQGERDYFIDFGDAHGSGYLHAPMHLLAYGIDSPALRWYVQKFSDQNAEPMLRLRAYDNIYNAPAQKPDALSVCYDKIGWAMFRDTYETNGTLLGIKCGDTWNHAHADAAHFILYRNGIDEIYDTGAPTSYSSPLYISYYVDSKAHNTLLFEGKGQDVRDNYKNHAHLPGKLYNYVDKPGFRYVAADATGPMSRWFRKFHRHFAWLDGFILIYDDVECYDCGTVNFVLHAQENTCFRMLTPARKEELSGWMVTHQGNNEYEVPYVTYSRETNEEGHVKFISVLLLDETKTPVLDEQETYFKLTVGDTVVYMNKRADGTVMHRNCDITADGIYTDAELLVCKDGSPYAVANGSIVRGGRHGEYALDVWARVTDAIPHGVLHITK